MTDDLNNAAFGLLARALPVPDGGFLPVNSRHPSNPKDTRAFIMLGRYVVKDYSGFTLYLLGIKGIFHQHEDVDLVRLAPASSLEAHPSCIRVNVRQTQVHINFGPHATDMFDNGWCLGHELGCTGGLPELFERLFKPLNLFLSYLELGVVLNHSGTSTRPTRFPRRFVRKKSRYVASVG
jgi:hypothetical protein